MHVPAAVDEPFGICKKNETGQEESCEFVLLTERLSASTLNCWGLLQGALEL